MSPWTEDELVTSTCPSDEDVAAWIDKRLDPQAAQTFEAHAATCERCGELLGELLRFEEPVGEGVGSPDARRFAVAPPAAHKSRRAWYWAGAAAAGVAGGLLLRGPLLDTVRGPQPEAVLAEFRAAAGSERTTVARLSGFAWGPPPQTMRGANDGTASANVLAAAAEVERTLKGEQSAAALHAYGVALLVAGDLDGAVQTLESARATAGPSVDLLVDLSAAYLERGRLHASRDDLERAVEVAGSAVDANPRRPDAWFNIGLAREYLADHAGSADAMRRAAEVSDDARWAAEALERSRHPPD